MGSNRESSRATAWSLPTTLREQPASLYAAVVVGTVLRLYGLGAEAYWLDEIASLSYVGSRTLLEVVVELPFVDRHPPLYYALLEVWTGLVGTGEWQVRLLSAAFGVAAIPALYLLGKRLYDEGVGVLAAGLLAVSGFHLAQSQNARMYSLLVLATVGSMYAFVGLRKQATSRRLAAYLGATAVLCYTHVFGLLVVVAQNGYVGTAWLTGEDPPVSPRRWVSAQAGVGLLVAPYLAVLLPQVLALQGGGGVALGWIPAPSVSRLVFAFGQYLNPINAAVGLVALGLVGILAVAGGSRAPLDRDRSLLLGWWVAVPVAVPFVLSYLVAPLFVARYTIAAMPAVLLLVAREIRRLASVEFRYIAMGVLVVSALATLPTYYGQPQNGEWGAATDVLERGVDGGDVVVVSDAAVTATVTYYYEGRAPIEPVQEDVSRGDLAAVLAGHDEAWLVSSRLTAVSEERLLRLVGRQGYDRVSAREFNGVTVYHFVGNGTDR